MKKILLLVLIAGFITSCINKGKDLYDPDAVELADVNQNIRNIFGDIDPEQDWNSVNSENVTLTADADLDDIVKIQILTEAPFNNVDAKVLNEVAVKKGQQVTVGYSAPAHYTRLVAACIDSRGVYYIKGFNVGQSAVSFKTKAAGSRMTRAGEEGTEDYPDPLSLQLEEKNSCLSYNAIRTIKAGEGETTNHIDIWKDKGWENERLWRMNDKGSTTTWRVQNQTIIKMIGPIAEDDKTELEDIFNNYLGAKTASGAKKDNLATIRNNPLFTLGNNHLTTDGVNPVTVIPVQMISSEIGSCHLYYYYYDPATTKNMSSEEEVQFLKNLPKYKAIQCQHTKSKTSGNGFFNIHQYLLVYFGDGTPADGQRAQSIIFPKGYKIGFMLRKLKTNSADSYKDYQGKSYTAVNNGCIYGDGRLNTEVNQLAGHFGSSVTFYSMQQDDPRIAVFGANGKTYMTFEDGADCNFCDMIVQVTGVEDTDEPQEVEGQVYTMLFEDHPLADYDMNDVVLKLTRIDNTHIKVCLAACGANDELYLRGLHGSKLNENTEIHAMFNISTNEFANTKPGSTPLPVIEEVFTVPANAPIEELAKTIYVYDKSINRDITLAGKGDDPHTILIPCDFEYPAESVCIKKGYPKFLNWARDASVDIDWYLYQDESADYIYKVSK